MKYQKTLQMYLIFFLKKDSLSDELPYATSEKDPANKENCLPILLAHRLLHRSFSKD